MFKNIIFIFGILRYYSLINLLICGVCGCWSVKERYSPFQAWSKSAGIVISSVHASKRRFILNSDSAVWTGYNIPLDWHFHSFCKVTARRSSLILRRPKSEGTANNLGRLRIRLRGGRDRKSFFINQLVLLLMSILLDFLSSGLSHIHDLRSELCRVKYFAHKYNWKQWTSGGANVKAWMLFLVIVEKYVMSLLSTSRLASAVLLAVEWT